jgi:hypothetical protein
VQWQGVSARRGRPTFVAIWNYPGTGGVTASWPSPQPLPAAVYLLAKAMTGLPEERVSQVLRDRWGTWVDGRSTDAQLAAALGIQVPNGPLLPHPES